MAPKKKPGKKKLGKKDLKKTKGGILIGLNQPTVNATQWKLDLNIASTPPSIINPDIKF